MSSQAGQRPKQFLPRSQGSSLASEAAGSFGLGGPQFSRVNYFLTTGYRGCGIEHALEFAFVPTSHPKLGDPYGGDNSLSLKSLEFGTMREHGFWGTPKKALCDFICEMRCWTY